MNSIAKPQGWLLAALSIGLSIASVFSHVIASSAVAQGPAPPSVSHEFGLLLPPGEPKPGGNRRVVVDDGGGSGRGKLVVGKVKVEVGDRRVVMLPDGRLVSLADHETTATDRPFEPATKAEIAAGLVAEKLRGFKSRETNRYLYLYNASEPFCLAASRILETMYPSLVAYCKREKLPVQDPETPLVVILFRTEAEYQAYRPMPAGIVAYYDAISNRVVVFEQSQLAEVAPAIAIKQSISTIAHEGVHQVLNNIGVQQRLAKWPPWIGEGLADYFAPTAIDREIKWKGVGLVHDLRMHELIAFLDHRPAGAMPGDLVRETVEADSLTSAGYAVAWALTHSLAKSQRTAFFAYLREVSLMPSLVDSPASQLDLFEKHFGGDLARIESQMLQSLSKLPYLDPIVNQPHFVAVLQNGPRRSVFVNTSPAAIRQWQEQLLSQTPPAERAAARFSVQVFSNKPLADQAAQTARGD